MSIYLFWVPRLQTENTMMNKTDLPPKPNYSSWCMFLNVLSLIFILLMNSINPKKELDYGEQAYITLLLKWERGHFADLYCLLNKLGKKKNPANVDELFRQTQFYLTLPIATVGSPALGGHSCAHPLSLYPHLENLCSFQWLILLAGILQGFFSFLKASLNCCTCKT